MRRYRRAWREKPSCLSRGGPDLPGDLNAAEKGRTYQPDDAAGEKAGIAPAIRFEPVRQSWALQLPEGHFLDQMIGALAQDEVGARTCGQDVFAQVLQVDVMPETFGDSDRCIVRKFGIAVKEGLRIPERRFAQPHEAFDIPLAD